jgi:hypothetical protein
MTQNKLDIFDILKSIDNFDIEYFDNLTEDEIKTLHPLVIMRWLSGTKDLKQIVRVNSIVNPFVFSLHKERKLLTRLLLCCSTSKKMYSWKKRKKQERSSLRSQLIQEYYDCTLKEALLLDKSITLEDLVAMAEDVGYDNELIKKLK